MKIITSDMHMDYAKGTAVALGSFDGLHKGHTALIERVITLAKERRIASVVYTFSTHPMEVLGKEIRLITPLEIKAEILEKMGVDMLYLQQISAPFMQKKPEEFVQDILFSSLHAKCIVAGYNFKFGKDAGGTAADLSQLCHAHDITCEIMQEHTVRGEHISSSAIRDYIEKGQVKMATRLMGRPFMMRGIIIRGRQEGRKIGYPTANIVPLKGIVLPAKGAYAAGVKIDGRLHMSIVNVGYAPTFGINELVIEAHILDFDADLYGQTMDVYFLEKLRDEEKFESVAKLKERLKKDEVFARALAKSIKMIDGIMF